MLTLQQMAQQMSANVWFKSPFKILKPNRSYSLKNFSADARRMFKWTRHFYILTKMPLSTERLCKLDIGDVRLIASLFKKYDYETMLADDKSTLIKFICGHQENVDEYLPLEPIPFGSLPDLD